MKTMNPKERDNLAKNLREALGKGDTSSDAGRSAKVSSETSSMELKSSSSGVGGEIGGGVNAGGKGKGQLAQKQQHRGVKSESGDTRVTSEASSLPRGDGISASRDLDGISRDVGPESAGDAGSAAGGATAGGATAGGAGGAECIGGAAGTEVVPDVVQTSTKSIDIPQKATKEASTTLKRVSDVGGSSRTAGVSGVDDGKKNALEDDSGKPEDGEGDGDELARLRDLFGSSVTVSKPKFAKSSGGGSVGSSSNSDGSDTITSSDYLGIPEGNDPSSETHSVRSVRVSDIPGRSLESGPQSESTSVGSIEKESTMNPVEPGTTSGVGGIGQNMSEVPAKLGIEGQEPGDTGMKMGGADGDDEDLIRLRRFGKGISVPVEGKQEPDEGENREEEDEKRLRTFGRTMARIVDSGKGDRRS